MAEHSVQPPHADAVQPDERDEFGRVKVEPTRMSFDDLLDAYTLQRLRDDLAAMHAVMYPCWENRRG